MKGCTTIRELEDMPNSYSHTIYKEYVEMLKDKSKSEATAGEEFVDELEDKLIP